MDFFLEMDPYIHGIGIRHMALPEAKQVASKLFDTELRNIADGGHLLLTVAIMLLVSARWIGEVGGAQKARAIVILTTTLCGMFIFCISSRCLK
jgi:hypothetical protein